MCRGSVEKKKRSEEKLDVLARCRESIKSKAKRLDRKGCVEIFFEKLSTLKKRSFSREEKHIKMNATSKILKQRSFNMLISQNISQHISIASIDPKHTHIHKTSLTNFIFQ